MKKETIKTLVIGILAGIIIAGGTSTVIAYTVNSNNVNYNPSDSAWKVNSVAEAIDDLYIKKTGDNYSTEERVVGTWIDGKPLYQKVVDCGAIPKGNVSDRVMYTEENAEFMMLVYAYTTAKNLQIPYINPQTSSASINFGVNNNNLVLLTSTDRSSFGNIIAVIQYTKTTDTVENNNQG